MPVLAVNESRTERTFNDRYGTGQSALDGILRATNLLLAGRTLVLFGYGATGRGIAQRAAGAGAAVIVCEVDPLRALEARMDGFEVMPALGRGRARRPVRDRHRLALRAAARALRADEGRRRAGQRRATSTWRSTSTDLARLAGAACARCCRSSSSTTSAAGRLNLLAQGRVVNLAAGQGHPAAVMDMSFANLALAVEHLVLHGDALEHACSTCPGEIDEEIARLKLESLGVEIDTLTPRPGGVPERLGGAGVSPA